MPTLVTPEGRAHRIENKAQLDVFAAGRPDIDGKHKGNISQLLGFDIVGSDRLGKHEASGYFCLEDIFTTWMYHADVAVGIPLFGSAPQRFTQLQERASIRFSLATFKRIAAAPGKRSEDGWWCGSPPPAVVAGLPDGASIYDIPKAATERTGRPAAQAEVRLPDFASTTSNLERAGRSFSSSAGSLEVSFGAFLCSSACCTRIRFLPRVKPTSLRGMAAD